MTATSDNRNGPAMAVGGGGGLRDRNKVTKAAGRVAAAGPRLSAAKNDAKSSTKIDARRWRLVLARDAAADGEFVYAVKTTGIYCRASCASRRPKRENVEFFATAAMARRVGYRECERCGVEAAAARAATDAEMVKTACARLDVLETDTVLPVLAEQMGSTAAKLARVFKRALGVSPAEYVAARKMQRFRGALVAGKNGAAKDGAGKKGKRLDAGGITAAIYAAGFGSSSRLYEKSRARLGMTPTGYRGGGAGERIRYTVAASPLGRMLVAASETGICAIAFGDADAELKRDLKARFAKAKFECDEENLAGAVRAVLKHLREPGTAFRLPLDLRATAFEQRVWRALQEIPAGETRSYLQVAEGLGRPTASRAVAQACGRNPVAVVVPCHRVVGSDGKLSGYRGGMERKKMLLESEKA